MYFWLCFIALLSLSQGLRFAPLGIPPALVMVLVYGAMTLVAFALLRSRLEYVFTPPPLAEHHETLDWSWRKTLILTVAAGIALWSFPLLFGAIFGQLSLRSMTFDGLLHALTIQILLVGFSEELFFREAGLSGWSQRPLAGLALVTLAFFIFHLHLGLVQASIAAGAGLVFGCLRVAGVSVIGIALLHGLTNVLFSRAISLGLSADAILAYTAYFLFASVMLSAIILRRHARIQRHL